MSFKGVFSGFYSNNCEGQTVGLIILVKGIGNYTNVFKMKLGWSVYFKTNFIISVLTVIDELIQLKVKAL